MMSLDTLLASPWVLRLGWAILHSVWQILAVSLVLALVLARLRRIGPRAAYAASCLALGCCMMWPVVTFITSDGASVASLAIPAKGPPFLSHQVPVAEIQPLTPTATTDAAGPPSTSQVTPRTSTLRGDLTAVMRQASTVLAAWIPLLVAVWTVGVLLLSSWNCAAWVAVLRLKSTGTFSVPPQVQAAAARLAQQLGLVQAVRVMQSFTVESPIVAGAWKPVIVLPAALVLEIPPDQLEALLAHEIAHILRQDYFVNLLQTVVETLLFYHPGVWWISRQIRREREDCCDDLALRVTVSRAVYVRALSAVAGARTPAITPAASGGLLIARLHRILGISRPDSGHPARWLASVALLSCCVLIAAYSAIPAQPAVAQSPPPEAPAKNTAPKPAELTRPEGKRVGMLCVDAEGKPVSDAEIYLFQHNDLQDVNRRYVQSGPFKSDEQGRAVGAAEIFTTKDGNFDRWIYARIPGRLVGVARCVQWTGSKPHNVEGQVKLFPSTSVNGEITVPKGFDPTQVTVKARTFWVTTGSDFFSYESFPREPVFPGLDAALPEIFDRRPDAQGHVKFDDVPVKGRLGLMTVADGLAEAQWSNYQESFEKPFQLTLDKESRLVGQVRLPDGTPAAGIQVSARIAETVRIPYLATFQATTNEKGEFLIKGLPALDIRFSVWDPQHAWVFRPIERLRVPAEQSLDLKIQLEKGVLISGRVADSDGKPVAGAGISAITDTQEGAGLGDDGTDKDGGYRFRIPSGKARIYFNSLPDGLDYPDPQIIKELEITPGQPDLQLDFMINRKAK